MAASVFMFNKPAPVRSPERTALADAQSEAAAAQRQADASRAAILRAAAMVAQAEARLAEATEAVAAAKAAQAARMATAAASGSTLAPDRGMRDARAREQDALDDLEAARDAQASVDAALVDAQKRLEQSKINVSNAAKRVVKSVKTTAISKALALRAELDAKTLELTRALNCQIAYLRFIGDKQCEECPVNWFTTDEDHQMSNIVKQENKILDWDIQREAFATWKQSLADLLTDPDAPLPVS